jgi:peptidoglycan biosynthesis protein MviN/MurJ (putative lipid II flippase)
LFLTHHIGPRGLSLSLSIAYSAAAIVALVVVRSRMGGLGGRTLRRYLARSFLLTLVMTGPVAIVTTAVGSSSTTGLLLRVVAGVLAGVTTYGVVAGLAGTVSAWQTARRRRVSAGKETHGIDPSGH